MSSAAQNLYTTAAEYLEGESNSDHWKKHIYTQSGSLVHLQSSDHTLPVSASYQSAAFPEDLKRPWYLINREDR